MVAVLYECDDPELIDALATMTGGCPRGWSDGYRGKIPPDFLDVAELEHHATGLRTPQTAHIPGPFQTDEHARALFDLFVPALPGLEVELRVAHRLARHSVVAADRVPYVGLVHEAALRLPAGGRKVAGAQLGRLLEESERPNVRLLVIPFAAEGSPMAGDTLMYVFAASHHLDTVEVDSPIGAVLTDSPTQLAAFRRRLDLVERVASNLSASRDLVLEIAGELQEEFTLPELPELNWIKSSFSEASGNACVEVSAANADLIAIRESENPDAVPVTSRGALRALVLGVKTGYNDIG
ncbi:DUF397 domain-containing protein [Streptomyces sp. NPDC057963]|uniref:DUF397 domain-containing protein n=1 Tax=Streptomyces sp. NPDC057963 TaxID=3346290 RepID=UPI0036E48C3E